MSKRLAAAALVGSFMVLAAQHDARACGGIDLSEELPASTVALPVPWTADEHALVIHDTRSEMEHLVREIRVEKSSARYELLLPVPERPEVARVHDSPFEALTKAFPPSMPGDAYVNAPKTSTDPAAQLPEDGALFAQRFGRIETYVLPPMSAAALDRWLEAHAFSADAARFDWTEHYTRLGFHFVAFRYSPTPGDTWGGGHAREVVRISFAAPTPYFPYHEPLAEGSPRRLTLFTLSDRHRFPIAPIGSSGVRRPFTTGFDGYGSRDSVGNALGELEPFLPAEGAFVTALRDHKARRVAYGDVLFVPTQPLGHLYEGEVQNHRWVERQGRALAVLAPPPVDSLSALGEHDELHERVRVAGAAFLGAGILLGLATLGRMRRARLLRLSFLPFAALAVLSCNARGWRDVPEAVKKHFQPESTVPPFASALRSLPHEQIARARFRLELLDGDIDRNELREDGGVPGKGRRVAAP